MKIKICLGVVLLVFSTTSATWFSPDSAELKHQVFTHTYELYMDARRKEYGYIGDLLIRYGWGRSGCLFGSDASKEYSRGANKFNQLKSTYNMQEATFLFYNNFLAPEQDKDLILRMISISAKDYMSFPSDRVDYIIRTGECADCDFRFPVPVGVSFPRSDCDKIKLFVERLRYRVYHYRFELEYYALMVFALSNFHDVEDEIDEVPEEKLNGLLQYLDKAAQRNGFVRLENTFYGFLVFRERKKELMQKDIEASQDPTVKEDLERQLNFHQLMTHMMLYGWVEIHKRVVKADPELTDGKVWLTGSAGQKHGFEVPQS